MYSLTNKYLSVHAIKFMFLLVGLLFPAKLFGIDLNDLENKTAIWSLVRAQYQANERVNIYGEVELRVEDNLQFIESNTYAIGADYRLTCWLRSELVFLLIAQHIPETTSDDNLVDDYWSLRQRIYIGLSESCRFGNVRLSLRERYQATWRPSQKVDIRDFDNNVIDQKFVQKKTANRLRTRFKADFNPQGWHVCPYASIEIYNDLDNGWVYDQSRWTLGAVWSVNSHNALDFYYRFIRSSDAEDPNLHILGITYTYKF